jgi:hypothetical protein
MNFEIGDVVEVIDYEMLDGKHPGEPIESSFIGEKGIIIKKIEREPGLRSKKPPCYWYILSRPNNSGNDIWCLEHELKLL